MFGCVEILSDVYTNGIIGPRTKMLGPVADGGRIRFFTTPGCWGPMITPTLRGGHEVDVPVAVRGAKVGAAIVIRFEEIKVVSDASSSGVDRWVEGAYVSDPYVAKRCPVCREPWPEFEVEGIGQETVRCKKRDAPALPFKMVHGYTMLFDKDRRFGLTVGAERAREVAGKAREYAHLPPSRRRSP